MKTKTLTEQTKPVFPPAAIELDRQGRLVYFDALRHAVHSVPELKSHFKFINRSGSGGVSVSIVSLGSPIKELLHTRTWKLTPYVDDKGTCAVTIETTRHGQEKIIEPPRRQTPVDLAEDFWETLREMLDEQSRPFLDAIFSPPAVSPSAPRGPHPGTQQ